MIRILTAGAACAALLAACNQNESPGQTEPVNKAQDAMSAAVGATSAATLGANTVEGYVSSAAIGDMYEIQSAQIALDKSQNAGIRELAQTIITDHTAASNKLKAIAPAAAAGVTIPTALDERRQGLIDNLRAATGPAFDAEWISQQVAAHREAVMLHEGFSNKADAPDLATHAAEVLPKIRAHLQTAETLNAG